jgi:hypothetical protein
MRCDDTWPLFDEGFGWVFSTGLTVFCKSISSTSRKDRLWPAKDDASDDDIVDEDSELLLVRSVEPLSTVDNFDEDATEGERRTSDWGLLSGNFSIRFRRGVRKVTLNESPESSSSLLTSMLSSSLLLS